MVTFACVRKNCIQLLKLLKNIVAAGLLLVIIISTSGITVFTHYCSGSNKTTHQILRELTGSKEGCGGMSCSINKKNSSTWQNVSIGKSTCCKENIAFYKVASVNDPPVKQDCIKLPFIDLVFLFPDLLSLKPLNNKSLAFHQAWCLPPPLAGKELVVFLRQIRIPAPSCFS
jgi:hypothetical protein